MAGLVALSAGCKVPAEKPTADASHAAVSSVPSSSPTLEVQSLVDAPAEQSLVDAPEVTSAPTSAPERIAPTSQAVKVSPSAKPVAKATVAPQPVVAKPAPKPVATEPPSATTYSNCDGMHVDYPHGVGRPGAVDHTSGTPVTTFEVNEAVYDANTGRDRDGDGIACEKA